MSKEAKEFILEAEKHTVLRAKPVCPAVFERNKMMEATPVSYTHLDVYKRQVIVRAGVAIVHKEHRVREVVLFGVFQKDSLLAVSYTHLDVYKRQGAGGAGMTAAITAAAEGKSVVSVESQAMVGGNSVRATGGMNAGKTVYQDEN